MQRTFLALLALVASARVQVSFAAAGFAVQVTVGGAAARTDVQSLTSVTMDICLAKQNFPCTDPDLLALTSHLGGGASLLRIGGSDQVLVLMLVLVLALLPLLVLTHALSHVV